MGNKPDFSAHFHKHLMKTVYFVLKVTENTTCYSGMAECDGAASHWKKNCVGST